ncbi:MAG: response regulator transcription factor [Roseibium sp.]|uniref:helix-turn-helix transcriptional regulator n=1 Tax=Roseibium sp. TaxID=1936156 RepID=UPI002604471B|nr:response regulator transcription factor [Roseibium sp.]MCV0425345.1 response regulator transcription factor [Roseibium sp.]
MLTGGINLMSKLTYEKKGSIYYIGSANNFPKELEDCIAREIEDSSFIRISQKIDLFKSEKRAEFTKRLFLIDDGFSAARKSDVACLRKGFPDANLCMLINDDQSFPKIIREYFQEGLIKSVLPMNLRVDLWLGAIRLMLNGGHYLPADVIKYMHSVTPKAQSAQSATKPARSRDLELFEKLTKRESEVLHLISEGYQNKLIADRLSLSEHTIKLHIHHIISKLGVTNRTEAAAIYLQSEQRAPIIEM